MDIKMLGNMQINRILSPVLYAFRGKKTLLLAIWFDYLLLDIGMQLLDHPLLGKNVYFYPVFNSPDSRCDDWMRMCWKEVEYKKKIWKFIYQ